MFESAARRTAVTCLVLTLAFAVPFLGASSTGARLDVHGTIEAKVDGRPMTWYSVSGESGGKPYSSSSWMETGGTARMIALGGFSVEDPPLETFEWGASGVPVSYGAFDGSVFGMVIDLPADRSSFTVTFPSDGGRTMLSYQPTATFQNVISGTFMVEEGTLTVTEIEVSGGVARMRGTFSGAFRTMSGDGGVEISDGTFDIQAIPNGESLRR